MAMPPADDGRIAVGYDVLVPEEEILPGAQGTIRILSPGFRKYRTYEDATWVTDLPRGFARYVKWLDHEKAAQRQMLAMVQEHCPETRDWNGWPGSGPSSIPAAARTPSTSPSSTRPHDGSSSAPPTENADATRHEGHHPRDRARADLPASGSACPMGRAAFRPSSPTS